MKPWFYVALSLFVAGARSSPAAEGPVLQLLGGFGRDLAAIAAPIRDEHRRSHVSGHLEAVEVLVGKMRGQSGAAPAQESAIVAQVLEIVRHLNQLHGLFAEKTLPEERETAARIDGMLSAASAALATAAEIRVSAVAEREPTAPGSEFTVAAKVSSPGLLPLKRASVTLVGGPAGEPRPLSPRGEASWRLVAAAPTTPTERRLARFTFEVDDVPPLSFVVEREVVFGDPKASPGVGTR